MDGEKQTSYFQRFLRSAAEMGHNALMRTKQLTERMAARMDHNNINNNNNQTNSSDCPPGYNNNKTQASKAATITAAERRARRAKCPPCKSFVGMLWDKMQGKRCPEEEEKEKDCATTKKAKPRMRFEPECIDPPDGDDFPCPQDPALLRSCCHIKEQNPLAPACCWSTRDNELEECPACPPGSEYVSQDNIRVPSCGCDACHKSGYHGRCYDQSRVILDDDHSHGSPIFEKA